MNFFKYNFRDEGWGFVKHTDNCWFGLDSNQQLNIGSAVVTKLAKMMSIQEPSGKVFHIIMSKPNARWLLNGLVPFTLHVLQNKDELRLRNDWLYFTTDDIPHIMKFNGDVKKCPRCKDKLLKNDPVVQCPNPKCRLVFHESDDRQCWSYNTTCICGHSTRLELSWQPNPSDVPKRNEK